MLECSLDFYTFTYRIVVLLVAKFTLTLRIVHYKSKLDRIIGIMEHTSNQNDTINSMADIPVIDLGQYLSNASGANDPAVVEQCKLVAECLHKYGILIIKDPRVDDKDNNDYIDLMEQYFESRGNQLYSGGMLDDAKPEHHYQVGVCPEFQEKAREHRKRIERYTEENKPVSPIEPIFDAKWRFMWKIGERPEDAADNFP